MCRVFQHSVEEIDLSGHIAVDAEWLAYLGAFRYLRVLKLADCKNVNSSAVWALSGTTLEAFLTHDCIYHGETSIELSFAILL